MWWDEEIDLDYFVYNQVEWVVYMINIIKERCMSEYCWFNMGGILDWVVDF